MATEVIGSTTLESSPGPTANSYSSLVDAKAYWDNDPNKDYSGLVDETLAKALITATMLIDLQYGERYKGELYDQSYALYWPRTGATDGRGVAITDYTEFPAGLAQAAAEQAYYGAQEDREAEAVLSATVMERVEGAVTVQYGDVSEQRQAATKRLLVSRVELLLKPFVSGGTGSYGSVMSRG